MGILALVLLVVLVLVAWAPQQATQMALAGVWVAGAAWVIGWTLYLLGRLLLS